MKNPPVTVGSNLDNKMVSLGDTVSTYFNRYRREGGVFWVSSDLTSGKKVKNFSFRKERGGGVLEPNSRTGVF